MENNRFTLMPLSGGDCALAEHRYTRSCLILRFTLRTRTVTCPLSELCPWRMTRTLSGHSVRKTHTIFAKICPRHDLRSKPSTWARFTRTFFLERTYELYSGHPRETRTSSRGPRARRKQFCRSSTQSAAKTRSAVVPAEEQAVQKGKSGVGSCACSWIWNCSALEESAVCNSM